MNSLYFRLAKNNIKKNKNTFIPFGISCGTMIALFYMLLAITDQIEAGQFYGAESMKTVLNLGVWICGLFSIGVIFYTNSFLMKKRTKELGLYSVLGLEKKHIGKVLFCEIGIIGIISVLTGLLAGVLLSKFMYLVLLNMMHLDTLLSFGVGIFAMKITVLLFAGIFLIVIVFNYFKLIFIKPIELLRGDNVGEREPKAKWLSAIVGGICLFIGYYIAVTTDKPLAAMNIFFVAVLFVIAGTYLIFMSGSIAILKILKKNKKYYYHRTHFITISGMMYRMKQNAAGLSNICILSTMVLVVISTTVALYLGIDDELRNRYPKDVMATTIYDGKEDRDPNYLASYDPQLVLDTVDAQAQKYKVSVVDLKGYYSIGTVGTMKEGVFSGENTSMSEMSILEILTIEDYMKISGQSAGDLKDELTSDEVYLYSKNGEGKEGETVTIGGKTFTIKGLLKEEELGNSSDFMVTFGYDYQVVIVNNIDNLVTISKGLTRVTSAGDKMEIPVHYNCEFNLSGELQDKKDFSANFRDSLNGAGIARVEKVENIFTVRQEFLSIYSSLFFIGIFIGTLFLLTTVLIIYYKQISEGYDDRKRFQIMEKVGMSKEEVKKVIKNQILTVFFLPILLAIIHIAFAFNIIKRILALLNLTNVSLFIGCTVGAVLVFLVIYGIVYTLTARAYYKIVNMKDAKA